MYSTTLKKKSREVKRFFKHMHGGRVHRAVALPMFCLDVFLLNTRVCDLSRLTWPGKKMNYFVMGNNNYVRPQRLQRNILRFQKRKCVYRFSNLARPHP